MNTCRALRTAALLGRNTGLAVLQDALLDNDRVKLAGVLTHGKLTKAEGGGPRPELPFYQSLCADHGVPLMVLDLPEARRVENYLPENLDVMVVLSWKYIMAPAALEKVGHTGINIHRGELPKYVGLEPLRRAIEAGATRAAITAHKITHKVDRGPELARVWMEIPPLPEGVSSADHAETIKEKLLPLYAPLTRLAIDTVYEEN